MGRIRTPVVQPNSHRVRFSFLYLQPDHPKFLVSECSGQYFEAIFRQIRRFEMWTIDEFRNMQNQENRHCIDFRDTTETDGFPDINPQDENLWTDDPWQFGLGERATTAGGGRVHGFISDVTFYVVWFDPQHKLYP